MKNNAPKVDYDFIFTMFALCMFMCILSSSIMMVISSSSSSTSKSAPDEPSNMARVLGPGNTARNLALLAT